MAIALVASLATFGCTTNRTPGEGQPYIGAPGAGPAAPTSSTNGTSTPTTPPPMTSSYRGNEQALATRPHRLTPDEAALVMADHLPRVRVLGPVNPGPAVRPYASDGLLTGQVQNNVAILNTPVSVNSSLSSPGGIPVIASGTDIAGTEGAAVISGNLATTTPTTAALPVTVGSVSGGVTIGTTAATTGTVTNSGPVATVTPTTASSPVASPTVASTSTGTTLVGGNTPTVGTANANATTTTTAAAAAGSTPVTVRTLNTNAVSSGNVRVTSTNGKVVVTNVGASGAKQQ